MKPMLAASIKDINQLRYPVYISGKLDGIRCLIQNGKAVSRNGLPIPNAAVRKWLEAVLPEGADGEIISGTTFQTTTSAVMSHGGAPRDVKFFWFDWVIPGNFLARQEAMRAHHAKMADKNIVFWESIPCANAEMLKEAEQRIIAAGLEGVMVRNNGPYKHGRSTLKEGYLLKLKRFEDAEAVVVGSQELVRNGGANGETLGALLVKDCKTGVAFAIGTGFTATQRNTIWAARAQWVGKIVKYKSQPTGVVEAPRFPVFLGERHKADMG